LIDPEYAALNIWCSTERLAGFRVVERLLEVWAGLAMELWATSTRGDAWRFGKFYAPELPHFQSTSRPASGYAPRCDSARSGGVQ
jgi:hypothetical protein